MENCLDQIKHIFSASNKTKIAVIGKGSSVTEVNLDLLQRDYFIINLNDADIYTKADMVVFYRTDLYDSLKKQGFISDHYIAPDFFKIPDDKHVEVGYRSINQDDFEHIYTYFTDDDFYILDFTLLTAIKLVVLFQETKKDKVIADFIGFDFYLGSVSESDFQGLEYRNAHLKTQESFFEQILRLIQQKFPEVYIQHIGNKKYSTQSVEKFNYQLEENKHYSVSISELPTNKVLYTNLLERILNSNSTIIVAEFTNNHIGDKKRLLKMIELAAESGADMIKIQKRDINTFYTQEELQSPYQSPFGNTLGDYRKGVELTDDLIELIDIECRKKNMPWFASILDWNSYQHIKNFDCPLIKLPSTISNHRNYLKKVADDFKGDLVISTGFTDKTYEEFVLNNLNNSHKNLFLLQCTSSYPTPPEGCQVSVVRHYDRLKNDYPNIIPGFSSHDIGSLGCMLSVAAGAKMIEKHVKLGDLDWVHFDSVAIDLYENKFKQFVHDVRKAELMAGSTEKSIHNFEHHKYRVNDKIN